MQGYIPKGGEITQPPPLGSYKRCSCQEHMLVPKWLCSSAQHYSTPAHTRPPWRVVPLGRDRESQIEPFLIPISILSTMHPSPRVTEHLPHTWSEETAYNELHAQRVSAFLETSSLRKYKSPYSMAWSGDLGGQAFFAPYPYLRGLQRWAMAPHWARRKAALSAGFKDPNSSKVWKELSIYSENIIFEWSMEQCPEQLD